MLVDMAEIVGHLFPEILDMPTDSKTESIC
jgi:hypothetical protein